MDAAALSRPSSITFRCTKPLRAVGSLWRGVGTQIGMLILMVLQNHFLI